MNRKLSVKKERLTELTPHELAGVAGGAPDSVNVDCLSIKLQGCYSQGPWACTTAMSCGGGCESRDICQ